MFRRLVDWSTFLSLAFAIVAFLNAHFAPAGISLGLAAFLWVANGCPRRLDLLSPPGPRQQKPKRAKRQVALPPAPPALSGAVAERPRGPSDADISGPVSRLDPKWRDWLVEEYRDQQNR